MSTQHTPGPWEASTDAHGRGRIHGGGAWLASTWLATEDGNNARHLPAVANARLIAAAPDLLAVVKELQESAAYWSEYDVPIGIVDRINAAIAKATNF